MKCHRALAGTHPGDLDVQRDSGRWPAIRSITGPKSCDWLLGGVDLGTKEREAQRSQHQDGRSPTGWDRQGNPWWGGGGGGCWKSLPTQHYKKVYKGGNKHNRKSTWS